MNFRTERETMKLAYMHFQRVLEAVFRQSPHLDDSS